MNNTRDLVLIRKDIQAIVSEELGRKTALSEKANICFEQFYHDRDKNFFSWRLRLLKTIFDTTPAIFNQLVLKEPSFANFDYGRLQVVIRRAFYLKDSRHERNKSNRRPPTEALFEGYHKRGEYDKEKNLSAIIHILFGNRDRSETVTNHHPYPKRALIGKSITIDDLVRSLFRTIYYEGDLSDLGVSLLHMAGIPFQGGRVSRWHLESFWDLATSVEKLDPSYSSQQWILYYDDSGYKIKPFGVWNVNQLDESPLKDGSLWIARGNVIQPPSRFREEAISELENLINKNALEKDFQDFFERNPEFLLTLGAYKGIHSQLILQEQNGEKSIPDFFLEKLNSDFCDVVDLKRANMELARNQTRRKRFRDAIMEGVAQLEYYRNFFEDKRNREDFRRRYGLQAYRPRIVLIIGRRQNYYDEVESIRTRALLPGHLELRTYDDIVELARHYVKLISG